MRSRDISLLSRRDQRIVSAPAPSPDFREPGHEVMLVFQGSVNPFESWSDSLGVRGDAEPAETESSLLEAFWPGWNLVGYLVVLFAVVAGTVAFPFSSIWMALLFVVVGAIFVVAIPMIVIAYVLMAVAFCGQAWDYAIA